jgi:hypothetical protein
MQLAILAGCAIFFIGCGGGAEKPANANTNSANANTAAPKASAPTKEALLAIEKKSWDDWSKKNEKGIDGFMAANYVDVGRSGIFDRATSIKRWIDHKCEMKSITFSDEQMNELAEGVALLTYKTTGDIVCDGKPSPTPTYSSTLYVREGDAWKAAYYQEVAAFDAKGEMVPTKPEPKKEASEAKPDAASEEFTALEKKIWETWKARDQNAFSALVSDKFVGNGNRGRSDKALMLKNAFDPTCKVESFSLGPIKAISVSKDVTLIAYSAQQKGACGKDAFPSPVSVGAMYVKENGKWMNVYYMETKAE